MMAATSAATFAAVFVTLFVAHQIADHWVQSGRQAERKGLPGWPGRLACGAHVGSYTLVTLAAVVVVAVFLRLPVGLVGVVVGQAVSAVTHYWADRRSTLARLARIAGKGDFYRLGAPRAGHDDNPSLGTGSYALDQSWHYGWLFVAALLTVLV